MDKINNKMNMDKKHDGEDKKTMPIFVKYGLIAIAIIVVIAAGLLIYFNSSGSYVATVGSEKIGVGEFKYYLEMQKEGMLQSARTIDPKTDATTFWNTKIGGEDAIEIAKNKTLESLKDLKVQLIKAKEKKITLTKDELKGIDDNINTNIIVPMGGNKIKANTDFKKQYGVSLDEVRNMQIEVTIVRKYQSGEISAAKVADTDIKSYYDKHPEWYTKDTSIRPDGEEVVWARHILITAAKDATQEVKDTAKKKAEDLLAKLKAGADFVTLAKENSQDGNAQYGGDYVFRKGQMVSEFETAAFSLAPGQLYDTLVQTDYGFHIIKLDEKFAKGQPVSLKCATEYRDYGTNFIKSELYQEQLNGWKKDTKYNIVTTSVYKTIK